MVVLHRGIFDVTQKYGRGSSVLNGDWLPSVAKATAFQTGRAEKAEKLMNRCFEPQSSLATWSLCTLGPLGDPLAPYHQCGPNTREFDLEGAWANSLLKNVLICRGFQGFSYKQGTMVHQKHLYRNAYMHQHRRGTSRLCLVYITL